MKNTRKRRQEEEEHNQTLPWRSISIIVISIRMILANKTPILDCDEVYNYWEPLHYVSFGSGMQTWEYSPKFALRSYFYLLPLSILSKIITFFVPTISKPTLFYLLRCTLSLFSAHCELAFAQSLPYNLQFYTLFASITSAGMFHACPSFLPSSTVMQLFMLSHAKFLQQQYPQAILWGLLCILGTGWPFCALLWIPMGISILYTHFPKRIHRIVSQTILLAAAIQCAVFLIDHRYYRKWISSTWNILIYNTARSGDELYGVEPLEFYVKNLLLNFNLLVVLAFAALPISLLRRNVRDCLFYLSPAILWMAIVVPRPHKEERFLYPIYPSICVAAALSLRDISDMLLSSSDGILVRFWTLLREKPQTRRRYKFVFGMMILFLSASISTCRILALTSYYTAPLSLYRFFHSKVVAERNDGNNERRMQNLCTAGEWYRFPSSYFVPSETIRLFYVPSSFRGQLPAFSTDFSSDGIPFNDENIEEEVERYIPGGIDDCDYFVELFAESNEKEEEKKRDVVFNEEEWRQVASYPFLDANETNFLDRVLYLPGRSRKRSFGKFVLLERIYN